jgi:hypothetical protein
MQARGGNTWPAVPGAPTSPVATAGNASASVAFVAPANTGFPANAITGYRVTSSPGGFTGTGLTSPVVVTGLTNGTAYTFTVAAQNVNGYGPESVASNSVTPVLPNYVEEVFSTWLYTGNDANVTIDNGIDLAGKGGLVWQKSRSNALTHRLFSTVFSPTGSELASNSTAALANNGNLLSFNSNGFTLSNNLADSGRTYCTWTFRKQPKFFDVVTWTGTGTDPLTISHNLQSVPGCIIVKCTSTATNWRVHSAALNMTLTLNTTNAGFSPDGLIKNLTSTTFQVNNSADVNSSGQTYVAYLFAHNAGGFGLTGTDNVISCGSVSGFGTVVNLGFEPQWILIKRSDNTGDWIIADNMRGIPTGGNDALLFANTSGAETSANNWINLTSTGFVNEIGSGTYIYIAIRRGPMKVPTTGTSVFAPAIGANVSTSGQASFTAGFPVDLLIKDQRSSGLNRFVDRLRGGSSSASGAIAPWLRSTSTAAESASDGVGFDSNTTVPFYDVGDFTGFIGWQFRRAPGFFDEVCYTGNGATGRAVNHNLGVTPELVIVKIRDLAGLGWYVWGAPLGTTNALALNETTAPPVYGGFQDGSMTATTFNVAGINTNRNTSTFVAYLFATCPGVSKVGSYTGTGATQLVACGFAAGARFVLIKATSTTGNWFVWDSARGIVSGNDPYLLLNSATAEVTNTDWVDTATTGFELSNAGGNLVNSNGVSYIFLAIA